MLPLLSPDVRRDPYPLYTRLRESSPIFQVPGTNFYLLLDYDSVRRALTEPDAFSSRAAPPGGRPLDWLIFADPPRHTKLRGLINRAFTPAVVAGLEPRIRTLSRELLDRVAGRGEMDLVADFAVPLPLMVIAELLGIPPADRDRFRRWADATLNLADTIGPDAPRAVADFAAAKAEMTPYVADVLARRRAEPRDDLLTRLALAEVDGERLTDAEILGFFQLLLLAGSETTTNLISNAVLCFLAEPDQLTRLRQSPELLPASVEEVLRYRSPVQTVFRAAARHLTVHGQTIPAGALVLVVIGSANRDPRQFPEPEHFDITRSPNPHLAFGHGIHFCLGAPLARLEGRIALSDILERLPNLRRADDGPWEPRRAFHVHGPARLPIRFDA